MKNGKERGFMGLLMLLVSGCLIAYYVFGTSFFSHKGVDGVETGGSIVESDLHAVDAAKNIKNALEEKSRTATVAQ